MDIHELAGKNICILGYGREGQAMAAAIEKYTAGCRITIADKNHELRIMNYECQLGKNYLEHLDRFDVIIKSPGIAPKELLTTNYKLLTSTTQIFLDTIQDSGATVIGITGSKGKSTTASLIQHLLKAAGKHPFLVGNIGEPAIAHIADAKSNTFFVQEISSYQLMDLTSSPHIAVITSFFPEHLDYHGSLGNYLEAKKHITRFQTKNDVVFFHADSDACKEIAKECPGKKIPFSFSDAPVTLSDVLLKGKHNLGNIAAAFKVAMHVGVDPKTAIAAIKTFQGLPHRLESLGIHGGIEWVNDSISTTPQSAIAAIDALEERVETILLGGQDRGYDFSPLVERIKHSNIKNVILLPESGSTIGKAIRKSGPTVKLVEAGDMEEAVREAKNQKPKTKNQFPPIALLSPAAPSYGHFKNFEDRGEQFKHLIINRG